MDNIELKEFNSQLVSIYNDELKIYFKNVFDENGIINNNEKIENTIEEMKCFIEDKSAIVIGAFQKNKLIGFIWGYKTTVNNKIRIHISYFVVNEKYRKQGIGSKLIEKIYKIAKENQIEEVELMVTAHNIPAVNFYERQGFEVERVKLCKKI